MLAPTHALHNWECFGQLQGVRAAATFKSSHRPDGRLIFCLLFAGRRCLCPEWLSELLIMHHHGQHSLPSMCSRSKLPIDPMGFSHVLFCAWLAGRRCEHQQWQGELLIVHHHGQHSLLCACSRSKVPIAPMGKSLTCLPLTHACTTANASVNYSRYMPKRPSKVPIAPMGNC